MKHGSGIKDRDDKSKGIEILMTDVLTKINPTGLLNFLFIVKRYKPTFSVCVPHITWYKN